MTHDETARAVTGRIKLVADVAVVTQAETVMVRYEDPSKCDGEAGWFLPDDYLRRLEHPEDAARRILREQVGLDPKDLVLSHIESLEGDGDWHLIFHYRARLASTELLVPGSSVRAAEWFPLDGLPPVSEVAHDGWALDTLREIERRLPG